MAYCWRHLVRLRVEEVAVLRPHVVGQGLGEPGRVHDVHEDRHPLPEQLLRVVDRLRIGDPDGPVAPERRNLHAQDAGLVALGAQYPGVELVLDLQQKALQEDLRDADQPLHLDGVPEGVVLVGQAADGLEPLLLSLVEELSQQVHPVLQGLGCPLEELDVALEDRRGDVHRPAGPLLAQLAVHLRLQAAVPLQLGAYQVRLLHERHHEHQVLLELLHAVLVLPVVLLLGRRLLGALLEVLDPAVVFLLRLLLPLLELALQPLELPSVLRDRRLVAGNRLRLLLLLLALPLLLLQLQLPLELLLALVQPGLRLGLRPGLGLLGLADAALQLLRHGAVLLELLLRGAADAPLVVQELLPRHRVVDLPGLEQLRGAPSGGIHEHEDALPEGDPVTVRQGGAPLAALEAVAVHEGARRGLVRRRGQDARAVRVHHRGVLLVDAGPGESHLGLGALGGAPADACLAYREGEAELIREELVLVQVRYVRQVETLLLLLLLLDGLPPRVRQAVLEALLHLRERLLQR
mmetsp:Transcript_115556/g.327466  ORF Transcript_115556/g.327466 Transcript_115556/m.327466 type:complete len:521 (+) Transcript_115556:656-2218(+)